MAKERFGVLTGALRVLDHDWLRHRDAVCAEELRLGEHLGRRSIGGDRSIVDNDQSIDKRGNGVQVMADDDYAQSVFERFEHLHELRTGTRIEVGRRFVEDQ